MILCSRWLKAVRWSSEAHERYARFGTSAVLALPAAMIAIQSQSSISSGEEGPSLVEPPFPEVTISRQPGPRLGRARRNKAHASAGSSAPSRARSRSRALAAELVAESPLSSSSPSPSRAKPRAKSRGGGRRKAPLPIPFRLSTPRAPGHHASASPRSRSHARAKTKSMVAPAQVLNHAPPPPPYALRGGGGVAMRRLLFHLPRRRRTRPLVSRVVVRLRCGRPCLPRCQLTCFQQRGFLPRGCHLWALCGRARPSSRAAMGLSLGRGAVAPFGCCLIVRSLLAPRLAYAGLGAPSPVFLPYAIITFVSCHWM